jgi:threonine/homoserine/homoserine lactone efflux protein
MLLLTRIALEEGRKSAVLASLGIASGLLVHVTLAMTGCWIWLDTFPTGATLFRILAALYLLYLSARIIWPARPQNNRPRLPIYHTPYFRGLFCNLLNPKVAVVIASLSAPFLQQQLSPWLLGTITVAQGALLWCLWSLTLPMPSVRRAYETWQRPISYLFAACMAALALRLLYR